MGWNLSVIKDGIQASEGLQGFGLGLGEQPLLPLFLSTSVSDSKKVLGFQGQRVLSAASLSVLHALPIAISQSHPDVRLPSSQPPPSKSQAQYKVLCVARP